MDEPSMFEKRVRGGVTTEEYVADLERRAIEKRRWWICDCSHVSRTPPEPGHHCTVPTCSAVMYEVGPI